MQKQCTQCQATFEVTDEDRVLMDQIAPMIGGITHLFPDPTHCPECRQQRRYACRNDANYYPNVCMLCNKSLISSYSEEKGFGVLCTQCFYGDGWDPLEFGKEFDFNKSFFEQFADLRKAVPRLAIYHTQSENSEYTVHSSRNRNCYMGSSLVDNEEVYYADFHFDSKNCMDMFSCTRMERCYGCKMSEDCFQCEYVESCNNLSDSMYCYDCRGSDMLIGCTGLRKAQNKILNRDATKQECIDMRKRINCDPTFRTSFLKDFAKLKLAQPRRATWKINTEQCTGNYIWSSKDAFHTFNVRHIESSRYLYEVNKHTNTMDCCRVGDGEMLYECASIVDCTYGAFNNLTYQCASIYYSDNCTGTKNCFGSLGLKKHEWCILNKQYSQNEYGKLVPRIIEHMRSTSEWGEFFPIAISPFGYNETKAHEWYPLEKSDVLLKNWNWSEYEPPLNNIAKTIPGEKLPPDISDIPDDVLNWAIVCKDTGKAFKITKQELQFYRDRQLPIPSQSPVKRHQNRIEDINIRTLFSRKCGKCGCEIQTIYAPDRPEIVYCEQCYLKEVY